MAERLWCNSNGGMVMVEQHLCDSNSSNSNGGTVIVEKQWFNSNGGTAVV